jgi:hypothetical protein
MIVTLDKDAHEQVLCTSEALPDGTVFAVWDLPIVSGAALVRSVPGKSVYLRSWSLVLMSTSEEVFKRFHKDLMREMVAQDVAPEKHENQTDPGAPSWGRDVSGELEAVPANRIVDVAEDDEPPF